MDGELYIIRKAILKYGSAACLKAVELANDPAFHLDQNNDTVRRVNVEDIAYECAPVLEDKRKEAEQDGGSLSLGWEVEQVGRDLIRAGQWILTGSKSTPSLELEGRFGKLSENQQQFVKDVIESGNEVVSYSGRGMFGRECPAVHISSVEAAIGLTKASIATDSLGMGIVVYAPN